MYKVNTYYEFHKKALICNLRLKKMAEERKKDINEDEMLIPVQYVSQSSSVPQDPLALSDGEHGSRKQLEKRFQLSQNITNGNNTEDRAIVSTIRVGNAYRIVKLMPGINQISTGSLVLQGSKSLSPRKNNISVKAVDIPASRTTASSYQQHSWKFNNHDVSRKHLRYVPNKEKDSASSQEYQLVDVQKIKKSYGSKSHGESESFMCIVCLKKFPDKALHLSHVTTNHPGVKIKDPPVKRKRCEEDTP